MKAIVLKDFGGIDNFELAEVDTPQVKNKEVLVKIKATAFNPIDCQMRRGATESKLLTSPILGRELAGVIVATGADVKEFSVGEEIAAYVSGLASNGTYAEFISIPVPLVARKPGSISFAQAAVLPLVGLTALQCVERLSLSAQDSIFISGGAGGVGTLLIKLLVSKGFKQIITTAGNAASRNHLLSLGIAAGHIIDYKQQNYIAQLQALSPDGRYTYCIDLVGGEMSEVCADLLQVHGTYVDVTYLTTPAAREILFDKATTIVNIANYAYALHGKNQDRFLYGQKLATLFEKVSTHIISPPAVTVVGDLCVETVQVAHQMLEDNLTQGKKLVMVVE